MPNEEVVSIEAKEPTKKFRPRKKPIEKDAPTRQPRPSPKPAPVTESMIEGLKPKSDIKNLKRTEPRNEPLDIREVLELGLYGLSLRPGKLHYRVDASGYADLVKATYAEYNALDRYFERTVTPAMFEYYCFSLYWKRIYKLKFEAGTDTHRTYRQLEAVFPSGLITPGPIAAWLAGLGGFTDPSGKQFELDVFEPLNNPCAQGIRGYFGAAGPQTAPHYACNLAPYFPIYRLYAENCTNTNWIDDHYDYILPGLIPGNGGLPNENLLGYSPLIKPHPDIVRNLRRLGITSRVDAQADESVVIDNPPPFIRGIPYIKDLAEYISGKLSTYKEIKTSPELPTNKTGSSTQIGYVEGNRKFTEQEVESFSAHQLAVKPGSAIPIMKYRINRYSTIEDPRPEVFPFSFLHVPQGWHAQINTYFTYGAQGRWNVDDFGISSVNGSLIAVEFAKKYRV